MITTQEFPGAAAVASTAAVLPQQISNPGGTDAADAEAHEMFSDWPSARITWILRGLCAVAFCISGYLGYTALTSSKVAGCGDGLFDCSHVLSTRWSNWFGIPVGIPAFGLYAVCLGGLAFANSENVTRRRIVWSVMTLAGISAGLAAFWFISLQVLVIGHLCPWCLGAHSCGLIVGGLMLWLRPAGHHTTALATLSVLGVGVLVGGQLAYKPEPVLEVEYFDEVQPEASGVAVPPGEETAPDGDSEMFAPPGMDDDAEVFSPPGADDSTGVFAPPGADDESGVFAPPGADLEENEETEFAPPVIEEQMPNESPTQAGFSPLLLVLLTALLCSPAAAQESQQKSNKPAAGNSEAKQAQTQKSDAVASGNTAAADSTDAKNTTANKPAPKPKPKARIVSFSGGRTRLNVRHWPLIGNPDAKYIFVEMFDYTCPHCRNTHRAIDGAFKKMGDDLGIVVLPVPLDARCNSSVRVTNAQHREACEVARIAVAVWRCNPSIFHEFHDWMFSTSRSRTAREAKAYGERLVGKDKLDAELAKPYAMQYLKKHVQLYQRVGGGTVPKMLFPRATLGGSITSSSTMVRTIERHLK